MMQIVENKICRTCLRKLEQGYKSIDEMNDTASNIRDMLQICIPEMDLYVSNEPVICNGCFGSLKNFYNFKNRCIETETKIQTYVKENRVLEHNQINLNCIVDGRDKFGKKSQSLLEKSEDVIFVIDDDKKTQKALPQPFQPQQQQTLQVLGCKTCEYITTDTSNLSSHVCMNQKSFKCELCPYSSHRRQQLNKHINCIHTKAVWHYCKFCLYKTTDSSSLRRHNKCIHPERIVENSFKCPKCPYVGNNADLFKKHLDRHVKTNEIYACEFCPYQSKDKSNFRKHVYVHASKPLLCKLCHYQCVSPYQMRKHVKKHHNDDDYERCVAELPQMQTHWMGQT